jgi:hypothetical protein
LASAAPLPVAAAEVPGAGAAGHRSPNPVRFREGESMAVGPNGSGCMLGVASSVTTQQRDGEAGAVAGGARMAEAARGAKHRVPASRAGGGGGPTIGGERL